MKKMYRERLLKLAELLESLPNKVAIDGGFFDAAGLQENLERGFNLGSWSCGTSACACGWAASDPWFKKKGFELVGYGGWITVSYKGTYAFQAAGEFFDILLSEAEYLFDPCSYTANVNTKPHTVAKRIRKFVEKREKSND